MTAADIFDRIDRGDISDWDLSDDEANPQIHEDEFVPGQDEEPEGDDSGEEPAPGVNVSDFEFTLKKDIRWRRGVLFQPPPDISWEAVEKEAEEEMVPKDFFLRYIPETFFELMATETNYYAHQTGVLNFQPTSAEELKVFVGLHIMMGGLKYPRVRMYWDTALRNPLFSNSMPINRFFKLRSNLHCSNNMSDRSETDKLWKVRPIFDVVRARCISLPLEECICVDEQMIPFRGQLGIKQYVKGKPCPWGIKSFMLCGASGLMHDFIIYQGSTTELDRNLLTKFGQGAAVVLQLSSLVTKDNHKLFFDNYFTSYNLLEVLASKKICAAGTVRTNRFANPPLSKDAEVKKKERGYAEEVCSNDGKIVMVKWNDNRPVVLASNFVGIGETDEVKRWDRVGKKYINVKRPQIVKAYNESMGGVDKMDFLISLYRIFVKSRKWTLRMIFHAVDIAVVNSWLEYKSNAILLGTQPKHILDLLHFRLQLAESLILEKRPVTPRRRGRPSRSSQEPESSPPAKRVASIQHRPLPEVQHDLVDHMPEHSTEANAGRCKRKNCSGKSRWKCEKCGVYLCLNKASNCFRDFHRK